MKDKVKNTFKELGITFPIDYNSCKNHINILTCDKIENYKKGLKTNLKIYNNFKFDTLIFKIEFLHNEDNLFDDLENSINILNRFIDICKLKKPILMKKIVFKDENNIEKEAIIFYWDLSNEKIKIKTLIKEILFLNEDGFSKLHSSTLFLDTTKNIVFSFYDDKNIKILCEDNNDLKKVCKKYKKLITEQNF